MGAKRKFTDSEMIAAINLNDGNISAAARELDVTRMTIVKRMEDLPKGALIADLEKWKIEKADVLADMQRKALQFITPDKMAKASINQLMYMFGILFDKERLEKGQSTENIAVGVKANMDDETLKMFKNLARKRTKQLKDAVKYDD